MAKQYHLFPAQEALAGLRDSGIKNTASAISEIIDNSMDANAKNIEILVFEKGQQSGQRVLDKINKISIVDDGIGMTEDILAQCLSVGGRDDGDDDDENHIGKFGYGLPNSSMSQCKRVEVYTWQKKNEVFYTYLDYEEVMEKKEQYCKPVEKRKIPNEISKALTNTLGATGTIIIWRKCDRLDITRGDTLYRHMQGDLCRIFRHRLDTDDSYGKRVNIKYKIVSKDFSEQVLANDPLYLMTPNTLHKYKKNNKIINHSNEATNIEIVRKDVPISYLDNKNEKIKQSNVKFIFTVAKPSIQAEGGGSPLGKHYAKNTGISVVRCAREISFKSFNFFDPFEARNRWWGCEIQYDGDGNKDTLNAMDLVFGLTNNKQEVTKFYYENISEGEDIYGEEEYEERKNNDLSLQMRTTLSKIFTDVHSEEFANIKKRGTGKRGSKSGNTSVDLVNVVLGPDKSRTRSFIEGQNKSLKQKTSEYKDIIKQSDPDISKEDLDEEAKSGVKRKVDIQFGEWPGEQFFTVKLAGSTAVGLINRLHPYYKNFYDKLMQKGDGNDIKTVDMLLMAFVRMEDEMYSMRDDIEKIRNRWGRYLQDFLEELSRTN